MTQPTSKRLVTEDAQTTAISNHAAATDPHGDRAYALTQVNSAIDALKAGVPGAYDTLVEIADKLGADDDALAGLLTAVDDKVDQSDLDTQTAALIGSGGDTDDALSATLVTRGELVEAPAPPRFHRDYATLLTSGDLIFTLGAVPLDGSLRVVLSTSGNTGATLLSTAYSLVGNVLTISSLTVGSKVEVTYAYDANEVAAPASAVTNQVIFDLPNRADSALTLGDADSGQTWQVAAGTFGIDAHRFYRAAQGASSGAGDMFYMDFGSADVQVQAKVEVVTTGAYPGGLVLRYGNGTQFFTSTSNIFRRVGTTNTQISDNYTQSIVDGDTIRLVGEGPNLAMYRQAGSAGAFVQIGAATDSANLLATNHGLRIAGGSSVNAVRLSNFRLASAA